MRDTAGEEAPRAHRVRFQPPLLFALVLGAGLLLQVLWPVPSAGVVFPPAVRIMGTLSLIGGAMLMAAALVTLRRARTPVNPNLPPARLVTTGPYRFGRNPIYLAFCLMLSGLGLIVTNVWLVLAPIAVVPLLNWGVIRHEEAKLGVHYGTEYAAYLRRVRRWL